MNDKKSVIGEDLKTAWADFLKSAWYFAMYRTHDTENNFNSALAKLEHALEKNGYKSTLARQRVFRKLAHENIHVRDYQDKPADYDTLLKNLGAQLKGRKLSIARDAIKTRAGVKAQLSIDLNAINTARPPLPPLPIPPNANKPNVVRVKFQDKTPQEIFEKFRKLRNSSDPDKFRALIARNMTILMNNPALRHAVHDLLQNNVNFFKAVDRSALINEEERVFALIHFPELASNQRYLHAGINAVVDEEHSPEVILGFPQVQAAIANDPKMVKRLEKLHLLENGELPLETAWAAFTMFVRAATNENNPKLLEYVRDALSVLVNCISQDLANWNKLVPIIQKINLRNLTDNKFERVQEALLNLVRDDPTVTALMGKMLAMARFPIERAEEKQLQLYYEELQANKAKTTEAVSAVSVQPAKKLTPQEEAWVRLVKACEEATEKCNGRTLTESAKQEVVKLLKPKLDKFMMVMGDKGTQIAEIAKLADKTGIHFDVHANQNAKIIFNEMSSQGFVSRKLAVWLNTVFSAMEKSSQTDAQRISPRHKP